MGFNCDKCSCSTVEDFVNRMSINEDEHLNVFICYIKSAFLDDELREHDRKGLAWAYNGELYWKNNYKIAEKYGVKQVIFYLTY